MPEITKDEFGPEYIVKVYNPQKNLEGFLVIDNTARGPGKGGIRMTPDITEEEVFRLARTMTWKTALADIPFGGAKAGIRWQGGSDHQKKELVQGFARAIKIFTPKYYIAGPDVNTGEKEMQWFVEATRNWRSATGKPQNLCMKVFGAYKEKCGIPHEFGSTGFGVAKAAGIAAKAAGVDIKKAKVSIHGFGNVGTFTYKYLTEMGATIVAIADKSGVIFSEDGFDKKAIEKIINAKAAISQYKGKVERLKPGEFWGIPADILIPASVTDVINEQNKDKIASKTKIIVEAANIPMKESVEKELFEKGILIVPDFLANAGGVISSYAEYRGHHLKKMFELVERKITKNTNLVLSKSIKKNLSPRDVALDLARSRVIEQMEKRGRR